MHNKRLTSRQDKFHEQVFRRKKKKKKKGMNAMQQKKKNENITNANT